MKKRFSVFFVFLAFLLTIGCVGNFGIKKKVFADDNIFSISSKSAYLIDANTSTVIYSENETEHRPIASMCKIMTLLLCFENIDSKNLSLDDEITVSDNASGMGGSQVFLESGAKYKVGELIKSITVASANDACVAMAEAICGSETLFVAKMNERAKELNMNDTVFVNCTGLPKAGQYSCAKDVATMFSKLILHEDYFKFSRIWMDEISHPKGRKTEISNTNKLIRFYNGCDCGKTGYTSEAGHCLCASAKRNGMRLISVVICSPDSKTRFKEISSMFDYGFANYTNKLIVDSNIVLDEEVIVKGGKKETVSTIPKDDFYVFSKKDEKHAYEFEFEKDDIIKAPVLKGDKVGKLKIFENRILIATIEVVSNEDVAEKTYFDSVREIIDKWAIAS